MVRPVRSGLGFNEGPLHRCSNKPVSQGLFPNAPRLLCNKNLFVPFCNYMVPVLLIHLSATRISKMLGGVKVLIVLLNFQFKNPRRVQSIMVVRPSHNTVPFLVEFRWWWWCGMSLLATPTHSVRKYGFFSEPTQRRQVAQYGKLKRCGSVIFWWQRV